MSENRGRKKQPEAVILQKWVQTCYEYPAKPELGYKAVWNFDMDKNKNGAWKVDHTPAKEDVAPLGKVKITPQTYNKQKTVIVFEVSARKNAKVKMKVFNKNVDFVLSAKKLPGVPENAVWLEVGIGESFIAEYKSKYSL